MSTAEIVRERLAAERAAGARFDAAWERALADVALVEDGKELRDWVEALHATERDWREAFHRLPARRHVLAVARLAPMLNGPVDDFATIGRGSGLLRMVA
ncbi:hypothetical protein OJ997_01850 [Solirubrobacter phytolaccae]|uniref:Uncharacterized protein n=1 Tax=Solirubrobacter phytolaccae TaxID=1404360 RepID=A0A9X3NAC2_9ACTN|nr:hypothetical protein [Solirubrobacter phytolaccae]MDA0179022.1 hypothetical protein [Solirubrobacter phytolaccae]